MRTELARILSGIHGFRRHRARAVLSVLGVTLAVAVSVSTLAVNDGVRRQALSEAERLGSNTIAVRVRQGSSPRATLTVAHAHAVSRLVPSVAVASPSSEFTMTVSGPLASASGRVLGVTAALREIRDVPIRRGRFLLARDDERASRVCLMGGGIARRLFGYRPPLGARVRLGSQWFRVVGVLDAGVFDDDVLAPLSSLLPRSPALDPSQAVGVVWTRVRDGSRLREAAADIAAALERAYGAEAYDVVIPRELVDTRDATQRMFSLAGSIGAALLFLLGAVAITNTMLTSVVERTSEIGLRRAVGATRRDIVLQFVLEAAAISGAGGLVGLLLGFVLAAVTGAYSGWPIHVSIVPVLALAAAAIATGVASGVYPALRAAGIQPIQALSHE